MGTTPVEDLSGEGNDSLAGYRSLLHGARPTAQGLASEQEEAAALVDQVHTWLAQGIRADEIAVCTRFNLLLDKVSDRLRTAGIPAVRVRDSPGPDTKGVRLATMHAMKGLEFRCVAILGVTAAALPFAREITPREVDPQQYHSDLLRERCVLFVACTRARDHLYVSYAGEPSVFLHR